MGMRSWMKRSSVNQDPAYLRPPPRLRVVFDPSLRRASELLAEQGEPRRR